MELESKYTLAGLFVLVTSVLILVTLLWITDSSGRQNLDEYLVIFTSHSLDGLQRDSDVTMKGIKIGSVETYSIAKDNIESVRVTLLIDREIPIKENTRAVIRRNILTGLAWVDLIGGTQDSPKLAAATRGELPIIAEGNSEIDKFAQSLPAFVEQANETLAQVRMFFSQENAERLSQIIADVNDITTGLKDRGSHFDSILTNFDKTLQQVSRASTHFESMAAGLDKNLTTIGEEMHQTLSNFNQESTAALRSVRDSADSVSEEIVVISQSISDTSQALSRTMEAFEEPRAILTGPSKEAFGPGE